MLTVTQIKPCTRWAGGQGHMQGLCVCTALPEVGEPHISKPCLVLPNQVRRSTTVLLLLLTCCRLAAAGAGGPPKGARRFPAQSALRRSPKVASPA